MQAIAIKWKKMNRLGNPQTQPALFLFSLLHSTPTSLAKWKSKWDVSKDDGSDQQPSTPYVRYAARQKRADAKKALKNLLLYGNSSKHYIQNESLAWCEEINRSRKDGLQSKNRKRYNGNRSGSKFWQNKRSFYFDDDDDDDDYEKPEPKYSSNSAGFKCYTWSFESWENSDSQSSTSGFEWRDVPKWDKAKQRVWNESDEEEDSPTVGLYSHRVALGLPPTGPLKLDDVKSAFRASALKWHPDKHQGPSQAIAGEKFKLCVDAYKSICNALKPV